MSEQSGPMAEDVWFVDYGADRVMVGPFHLPQDAKAWADAKGVFPYWLGTLVSPGAMENRVP